MEPCIRALLLTEFIQEHGKADTGTDLRNLTVGIQERGLGSAIEPGPLLPEHQGPAELTRGPSHGRIDGQAIEHVLRELGILLSVRATHECCTADCGEYPPHACFPFGLEPDTHWGRCTLPQNRRQYSNSGFLQIPVKPAGDEQDLRQATQASF